MYDKKSGFWHLIIAKFKKKIIKILIISLVFSTKQDQSFYTTNNIKLLTCI